MALVMVQFTLLFLVGMFSAYCSDEMPIIVRDRVVKSHFCSNESKLSKKQIDAYFKCGMLYVGFEKKASDKCFTSLSKEPLHLKEQYCDKRLLTCLLNGKNVTAHEADTETEAHKKIVACGSSALGIDLDATLGQYLAVEQQDMNAFMKFCSNATEINLSEKAILEGGKCEYIYYESQPQIFISSDEALKGAPAMEKCRKSFWTDFGIPLTANDKRKIICGHTDKSEAYMIAVNKWLQCIRTELRLGNPGEGEDRLFSISEYLALQKRTIRMAQYVKCMETAFKQL